MMSLRQPSDTERELVAALDRISAIRWTIFGALLVIGAVLSTVEQMLR